MGTVTISGVQFNVYGDQPSCANYLLGSRSPAAVKWRLLSSDDQARTMIDAARWMDTMSLTDPASGTPITEATAITDVVNASYQLAAALAVTPALSGQASGGSNIKSIKAGPSDIEFWQPQITSPIPQGATALLSPYFGSNQANADDNSGIGESPNAGDDGGCYVFTDCWDVEFDKKRPM